MISVFLAMTLACSGGSEAPTSKKKTPKASAKSAKQTNTTAKAGEQPKGRPLFRATPDQMNVTAPKKTHKVADPMLAWDDYNVYPADNAVVLQGAVEGPIGDQSHAQFWLVGVHEQGKKDGPSHLEGVMVYAVDCDDCPGEETSTGKIASRRSTAAKPAQLLGVEEMRVEDVDKDGQFEVVANARFRPCCDGDEDRRPYSEQLVIEVKGTEIVRSPVLGKSPKK